MQTSEVSHYHPPRSFAHWQPDARSAGAITLGEVRDTVRTISAELAPEDHSRSLNQWMFTYPTNGAERSAMAMLDVGGLGECFQLTRNGYSQLLSRVLPGHAGKTLDFLRAQGESGSKVAGLVLNMGLQAARQPGLVRTVSYGDCRVVRSVHSMGYRPFDCIDLLESLMEMPEVAELPVVSWRLTDTAMRVRCLLRPEDAGTVEVRKPLPMLDIWDSETGNRAVWLQGGIFRYTCLNGMGGFEDKSIFRWPHITEPDRVRKGVSDALTDIRVATDGTLRAYQRALSVTIDDAVAWMSDQLDGRLTLMQLDRATEAMTDATSTPGGKLASVVDGLTLAAQAETDLIASGDMEALAADLLRRGLGQAERGRIRMEVA